MNETTYHRCGAQIDDFDARVECSYSTDDPHDDGRFWLVCTEHDHLVRPVETMKTWTKKETKRRIRVAAALARTVDRELAKNDRLEVGTRSRPVYATSLEEAKRLAHEVQQFDPEHPELTDDLVDVCFGRHLVDDEQIRRVGYVAHLYFYGSGSWGELKNTITVWLGDENSEPELVSVPGSRL